MSKERQEIFFKVEVPLLLKKLDENSKPAWGILTPQSMLEHIVGSWRISNGRAVVECKVPEEKLKKLRDFLFSDKAFKPNVKNPMMPENEAPAHRKPSLEHVKKQLIEDIDTFFEYFEKNPEAEPVHPIFGKLNKAGWLHFQEKHMKHHFKQFGLIE
jgi:oxepin-CoA hydrolase / 3-oxo-5,6-dehydrosuberyl-CoA semialdehyde dehydrogenase